MKEFLIEEYKLLVAESQELMSEARKLELYCAGAVAAVYSWFLSSDVLFREAWFFPVIVPILGMLRSWAFYERVNQISRYIQETERTLLTNDSGPRGWEISYASIRRHRITPTAIIFWVVLFSVCIAVPAIFQV